jgi:hypothetical protein
VAQMIYLQIALQILKMVTMTTKMMDQLARLMLMVMTTLMVMESHKVHLQAMNNKIKPQRKIQLKYPIRMMRMMGRVQWSAGNIRRHKPSQ